MLTLRLTLESLRFALDALKSNLLRTVLSLLGVTVGIFAIIAVFTVVDSLEASVRRSMDFVGDKVIYVAKWPWTFGPRLPVVEILQPAGTHRARVSGVAAAAWAQQQGRGHFRRQRRQRPQGGL